MTIIIIDSNYILVLRNLVYIIYGVTEAHMSNGEILCLFCDTEYFWIGKSSNYYYFVSFHRIITPPDVQCNLEIKMEPRV